MPRQWQAAVAVTSAVIPICIARCNEMKTSSIQDIRKITDRIDGWLAKREGPYLYSLSQFGARLGVVVEIGSWKGKSTVWLAKGSEKVDGEKIYAVDPHLGGPDQARLGLTDIQTEKEFKENIRLAGVQARVVPLVMTSMQAVKNWNQPIGLLWIDGDHSYRSVQQDFFNWQPHVVEGGIIAFHDTCSWAGVRRFIDEEILSLDGYRIIGHVKEIVAIKKVPDGSRVNRLKKSLFIYLREIYNRDRENRKQRRAIHVKIMRGLARTVLAGLSTPR